MRFQGLPSIPSTEFSRIQLQYIAVGTFVGRVNNGQNSDGPHGDESTWRKEGRSEIKEFVVDALSPAKCASSQRLYQK